MTMTMNKEQFFNLCVKAGFEEPEIGGLSGSSDDDESIYVGEYPCGESLLKLAELLGVEITD